MTKAILPIALGLLAAVALPGSGGGAVLNVGANQIYKVPSEAAAVAKDGDRIEIDPGKYVDCAVWRADGLIIEGVGPGVVITDKMCLGKGLFVIEGRDTTVRHLTLTNARVPDMNGAGIRIDQGDLTVDDVRFIDDQSGILGGAPGTSVIVRNSYFDHNGVCDKECAHGIYVNQIALLRVTDSSFYSTLQGHSIKSRALRTEILRCDVGDGADGTSSYLIDAPNGGTLIVKNNTLQKGLKSENHGVAIAIGEEGIKNASEQIVIMDNQFANDSEDETTFVWNSTTTPAILKNNSFIGPTVALKGDGSVQ